MSGGVKGHPSWPLELRLAVSGKRLIKPRNGGSLVSIFGNWARKPNS